VDFILDPLVPGAKEISATIEEFGGYDNVCLVTTSRMDPDIHGFHRIGVPTLSEDGAQDAFYSLCNLGGSPAVDDLIARLNCHPLSIDLLASSVRENGRDESMLFKAWADGTSRANYYRGLGVTMESLFHSPMVQDLGIAARDALGAIVAFPGSVRESILDDIFPGIPGIKAWWPCFAISSLSQKWVREDVLTVPVLLPRVHANYVLHHHAIVPPMRPLEARQHTIKPPMKVLHQLSYPATACLSFSFYLFRASG